jgi:dTDP-4-dehydrorhamnose reductase
LKILIAGASGQLGREINFAARSLAYDVVATDLPELDITDRADVGKFVSEHSPDAVFNTAAWTAVDDAEKNEARVFRINRDGARNLADACEERQIPLVHFSTDYVFDGAKGTAYSEADATNPLNVYGRSKLASEEAVRKHCEQHLILRTSWIFSRHGKNFVKSMLRLGAERANIEVVTDQIGKPTSASVIAEHSLFALSNSNVCWGTYHLAQPEAVSWYEFAKSIFQLAGELEYDLKVTGVDPIESAEYQTLAMRPYHSELDCTRFEGVFATQIPGWYESLRTVLTQLRTF